MPDSLRRRLSPRREDRGTTLVEILISMTIFSLALAMVYTVLITVQRQTKDQTSRADSVGNARLALAQMDRQIRSGNVLYNPSNESALGFPLSMRVYTQANGNQRCVQWQVSGSKLRSRSWSTTWQTDGLVSDWGVVAHDVVNTASSPPFALATGSTAYGSRLLDITLQVKSPTAGGKPVNVTSSLSGRNTAYGYDPGVCSPIPPA